MRLPAFDRVVPALVEQGTRRPWMTLGAALALVAAAVVFAATHFAMTTDTAALISPATPWRVDERAVDDAFPQRRDVMVMVIDGQTPELAEDAAGKLAEAIGVDHPHFLNVSRPDGGAFFAREGLLYGSVADVRATTASLVEAQPLLGPLAADPSLRGVAKALDTALDGVARGQTSLDKLAAPMRAMTGTIDAVLAGKPAFFSWQRLLGSGSGALAAPTRRIVLARPRLDYDALMPGEAAGEAIRADAARLGLAAANGVSVRLTGDVPLADEEFATLSENIGVVGLVMLAAMLLTLWLATRSTKLVLAIVATTIAGLIVTNALGLAAVGRLNLISVAFIPLFVGLGVDFGIQFAVRFNAERADGLAVRDALRAAGRALAAPLLLAAGAVFLGFGAFLPTDYVGIAELGVIAGLGMIVALLLAVTLLPALVLVLRPGAPRREVGFAQLAPADRWLAAHRRWVLWGFGIAMAASIAALPLVGFDFNPLHLRDPAAPAMRTLADLTRDPERTPNTIEALAPDRAAAATLAGRLSRLPEVRQAAWLGSLVPDDQPPKLAAIGDAELLLDVALSPLDTAPAPSDAETVAALRQTAAKLRAIYSRVQIAEYEAEQVGRLGFLPPPSEFPVFPEPRDRGALAADALAIALFKLSDTSPPIRARADAAFIRPLAVMLDQVRASLQAQPVSEATLPPEIVRDWRTPDGRYRVEAFPAGDTNDNRVLQRFRAAVLAVAPHATGLPVATQAAAGTVAHAFVQAGILAFVLVSLLLFAVLRDAKEVAFTLAPVILSIFLTLGSCVVIGQPVNFANIIAFPLLFGVGVAFHIYFVMAWRGGATDLLQSSLARAVIFSAFATGTAFGSLWLSAHPGTASMGKILLISLAWTLVCALIFEPALLGPARASAGLGRPGRSVDRSAPEGPDRA